MKFLKDKRKIFIKIDAEGGDIEILNEIKKSKIFDKVFNIYIESSSNLKDIKILKKKLKNFSLIKKNKIIEGLKDDRLINLEFEKKY